MDELSLLQQCQYNWQEDHIVVRFLHTTALPSGAQKLGKPPKSLSPKAEGAPSS
jgi:hypothetical protein